MATRARFHALAVAAIDRLTEDSVALTFAVPPELAEAYAHTAGQHVAVVAPQVGDGLRRSYSICTAAGSGVLRIGVKLLPGGGFSGFVADKLELGDRLEVLTPVGHFGPADVELEAARACGLVAAGSGITPLLSIAATVLAEQPLSTVTLIYANRTARSVMFAEEVADLKDRFTSRLRVVHVLSREPGAVELLSGRLDRDRMGRLLDVMVPVDSVDTWYLCGPHAMLTELRDVLVQRGADDADVHSELFHADAPELLMRQGVRTPSGGDSSAGRGRAGPGAQVEVQLDGRRSALQVPFDGPSVLEAALAVRADAPYSCRGGVCGTCRARLVQGTVRMDHAYALEPGDIADGFVLTCQSHPTSDRVVLDFDV
ncbi:MAG: 2Fe-2S iron-sulfur cluster-binding protein [Actinomycetota bacterium]|nr:2Fe-2S iron-sulfur cluster-binding protein [Actinomycetota bacterium]